MLCLRYPVSKSGADLEYICQSFYINSTNVSSVTIIAVLI